MEDEGLTVGADELQKRAQEQVPASQRRMRAYKDAVAASSSQKTQNLPRREPKESEGSGLCSEDAGPHLSGLLTDAFRYVKATCMWMMRRSAAKSPLRACKGGSDYTCFGDDPDQQRRLRALDCDDRLSYPHNVEPWWRGKHVH